jgi:glycerol-3-phosphate dehydrogenase subunit C
VASWAPTQCVDVTLGGAIGPEALPMTTTYDPKDARYLDEADVRDELTRVYDLCQGCRLCSTLCASFPTLFDLIDRVEERDAGLLTPAEQDRVVDECFQCKRCYVNCPYVPDRHEWALDFPRLMLRASAMRVTTGQTTVRSRTTTRVLGRIAAPGRAGTLVAPVVNRVITAKAGSAIREAMSKMTGVSSVRLLAPHAKQRFSTWFTKRARPTLSERHGRVTVFPTCLVEYHETGIGKDLVRVYERNGIECEQTSAGCCGAPWLHAGDVERFTKIAARNVVLLADEVRAGTAIVVPQPTCGYVLKQDYVDYVGGPAAELVAQNTYDAAEYLSNLHDAADTSLDTDFAGDVPGSITYHAPCHLRAQGLGSGSRDLMELTGAAVTVVRQCSGMGAMWGLRTENEDVSIPIARELGAEIQRAGGDMVAGDCHLANTAITEQTGRVPLHPIQLLARAYGISEHD